MVFESLFYACLMLCVAVFFDVLITFKRNSLLKVCFLLIISSVFVMNYFTYRSISNRIEFVLVKSMRVVYVCSTMLAIIHLVSQSIPRWIITLIILSVFFIIGLRIFYFNEINLPDSSLSNPVFSIGPEFSSPHPVPRFIVFTLTLVCMAITFYYYRRFLMKINREAAYYKPLSRWIISLVFPFFMLTIFGMLGTLNLCQGQLSSYLFSFFSGIIILSILFRPRFLNRNPYVTVSTISGNT